MAFPLNSELKGGPALSQTGSKEARPISFVGHRARAQAQRKILTGRFKFMFSISKGEERGMGEAKFYL